VREHDICIGGVRRKLVVDRNEEIERVQRLSPNVRLRPGGNHGGPKDNQRTDRKWLIAHHSAWQAKGMRFLTVMAVDRKEVAAEGLSNVRVGYKAVAVYGEVIGLHPEAAAAGYVQLSGESPDDKRRTDRLDAAVTGILIVMIAMILIESAADWIRILAGRKQPVIRETPFVATRFATEEQA
jgi:hypothetical protein